MKTVADFLRHFAANRDGVLSAMYAEWEYEAEHEDAYRKVWDHLLTISAKPTEFICVVERVISPIAGDPYIGIFGLIPGNEQHYAIEYEPWEEWLAMPVQVASPDISDETVAGLILYEMTWAGYDQNTIQEELDDIKTMAVEFTSK